MIKNIYNKEHKKYNYEYYCDLCKNEISEYGEIFRNEKAIKSNIFDLCSKCNYLMNGKEE